MNNTIDMNRLRCPVIKHPIEFFFSLVDYRNNLFSSKDVNKVIEFYDGFKERSEMVEWMKERPKGASYIFEVEGNREIIVVIATVNFMGENAKECRETIYKNLRMIFVESGGKGDFYFNLAHNYNVGIKRALEYNPKWIVLSNDDVIKLDDVETLIEKLSSIDNEKYDVVFTTPSKYHSIPAFYSEQRVWRRVLFTISRERRIQLEIERKFEVNFFSSPIRGYGSFFFKHGYRHLSIADFGIFSTRFIKRHRELLYDETYINSGEDVDISLEVTLDVQRLKVIDFQLGDKIGETLGKDVSRKIRDVAGNAYLNYKIISGNHPASRAVFNSSDRLSFKNRFKRMDSDH